MNCKWILLQDWLPTNMKEITLAYIWDWKMSNKFEELYHKPVCIAGRLDNSLLTADVIEEYNLFWDWDKWDKLYTMMVDIKAPENNPKIYMGSSLKLLLEKNWYKNYNWPIRVYGVFWIRPTTKTHIAQINKADILDEQGNVLKTIYNK